MADPTIQTFCCHHANGTSMALNVMEEFNTDAYNSVCMFSSSLGIIGAIYQILPREEFAQHHRWLSISATRGRKIIIWLAIADLLAAIGVFIRSTVWISYSNIMPAVDDDSSVVFCSISSALTQYFYTATWIWTLCYAVDMRLVLTQKDSKLKYYHLVAWLTPIVLTVTGLTLLYFPDANCHTSKSLRTAIFRILPNYFATYLPMTTVMIANPCLYHHSTKDMERIITGISGQCTSREREIIDAIKLKFFIINIIFYICWIPNLINAILLWTLWFDLPVDFIIATWYAMAFLNPLQAFFNSLVYRRWNSGSERIIMPWRHLENSILVKSSAASSLDSSQNTLREEIYPLLQNSPVNSVNTYKRYD